MAVSTAAMMHCCDRRFREPMLNVSLVSKRALWLFLRRGASGLVRVYSLNGDQPGALTPPREDLPGFYPAVYPLRYRRSDCLSRTSTELEVSAGTLDAHCELMDASEMPIDVSFVINQ